MTWTCYVIEGGEAESQRYSCWRNFKVWFPQDSTSMLIYFVHKWSPTMRDQEPDSILPAQSWALGTLLSKHMMTSTLTQLLLLPRKPLTADWTQGIECDTDSWDAERANGRVSPSEQRTPGKRSSSSGKGENSTYPTEPTEVGKNTTVKK